MINHFISKRLNFSMICFGVIAAISSSVYAWYKLPEWGMVGFAMIPVIIASSVFCWWLFIVRPQRASILRGVLAGIMGFISGSILFLLGILTWAVLEKVPQNPALLVSILVGGLVTFVVIILPLRCFFFLLWECAAKLLMGYLRRAVLPKMTHKHTIILRLLVAGLLIALAWFIGLQASVMLLAWGAPGGLFAWYLRRMLLPKPNIDQQTQQPLQQALQMMQ